jgi:hypothetical protein
MSSSSNPGPFPGSSAWENRQSADYFGHAPALRVGLGGMLAIAFLTLWFMSQVPLPGGWIAVCALPLTLIGYLGLRFYLTFSSVEFFADHVEIRLPGRKVNLPYTSIRKIRFDSFSHDLMVRDDKGEYRIPRTIQGHRVILHRLHENVEVERDHSPEMDVTVRILPKVACGLAVGAMAGLSFAVAFEMPRIGIGLLLICVPAAYLLLDQCVLRKYHFTPEELHVSGMRNKTYRRAELTEAWIQKSGLSSRFRMKFPNGTVEFDEYLLFKAMIQVTGYVERRWEHRVTPLSRKS